MAFDATVARALNVALQCIDQETRRLRRELNDMVGNGESYLDRAALTARLEKIAWARKTLVDERDKAKKETEWRSLL